MLDIVRTTLPSAVGHSLQFEADLPLLAFGFALSLLTALLFGTLPAIAQHAHSRDDDGEITGRRDVDRRIQPAAIGAGDVADRAGAGAARRRRIVREEPRQHLAHRPRHADFESDDVQGVAGTEWISAERSHTLFEQVADELNAVPGVTSVDRIDDCRCWMAAMRPQTSRCAASRRVPDADLDASTTLIGPQFFSTLGIPLITGREFTRADTSTSQSVAIVNEAFAKKFNLARDTVVGTRMELGRNDTPKFDIEIVGLVQDAKYSGAKDETPPIFYLPHRQRETVREINYYVRSSLDTSGMNAAVIAHHRASSIRNLPIEESAHDGGAVSRTIAGDRCPARSRCRALPGSRRCLRHRAVRRARVFRRAAHARNRRASRAWGRRRTYSSAWSFAMSDELALVGVAVGLAGAVALGRLAASMLFRVEGIDPAGHALWAWQPWSPLCLWARWCRSPCVTHRSRAALRAD